MLNSRLTEINIILEEAYETAKGYQNLSGVHRCRSRRFQRDKFIHDTLTEIPARFGIWPRVQPEDYEGGFLGLANKLIATDVHEEITKSWKSNERD